MVSRFFSPAGRRPIFRPTLEGMEGRECPAVTATFAGGVLMVVGDGGPNQVSVVELGGGAVEVIGDGERFTPFAGVESIVIETLDGDDRVHFGPGGSQVALGDPSVRLLSIDVGAGDDVMILRDPGPEAGRAPVTSLHFTVKLRGNTGSDFIRAEINHGSDVDVDVVTADGGDDVGIHVLQRIGTRRPVLVPHTIATNLDLGGGGNLVNLATGLAEEVAVDLTTSSRGATAPSGLVDRFALSFAPTRGADLLQGSLLIAKQRLAIDLGDADDRVTIDALGFANVSTDIDTGGGNDTVIGKYRTLRPRPSDPPTQLAFNARLGDGDDRIDTSFVGYADANLNLDFGAGAGADRGKVTLWVRDWTTAPKVSVNAQLGAGDDFFRLFTRGYDEVHADLDTGPDGDGRDLVSAIFVRPGSVRPRFVTYFNPVAPMQDQLQLLAVGYPTADVTLQGPHLLVHFLGGIP